MSYFTCFLVLIFTKLYAQNIPCNETESCASTAIDSAEIVTCPGYGSCLSATLTNIDSYVVCSGYRGCKYASIESNGYVTCNGLEGCAETTKLKSATYLICSSYKSCYNSVAIVGDNWVRCNGHAACQAMTGQISAPEITCSGAKGCYGATLTANYITGTNVSVSGYLAGQLMNLDFEDAIPATNFIHANGESSLTSATIYSGELNQLEIFIGGYLTGDGLEIYCESGSTCYLNCYGFGCPDVTFTCASDATCSVSCSNVPTTNYCPVVTSSTIEISEKKQSLKRIGHESKKKSSSNHLLPIPGSITQHKENTNVIMVLVSFVSGMIVATGLVHCCTTNNKGYQIIN